MKPKIAHVTTVDLSLRFLLLEQLRALVDDGFEVVGVSAPGPWVADLEAAGVRHVPWRHATRAWDPAQDALAFGELLRIFRRERFDLVHTHNPKPGVLGRIAARAAGVPHVVNTVHGLYATREDRARRRMPVLAAEWVAGRCSDLELYQSAEDLAWARRLGLTGRARSIHLGNGIDLERFAPAGASDGDGRRLRAELGIGSDELVVGTVGRMVREKGYHELLRAAELIRERTPSARFMVVGEPDVVKVDALRPEAMGPGAHDVLFTGWREDVADLMRAMDVFVLPSWREGLPRAAIEAAATGLPLVLTDIRGCREVVRDGEEGLLVPVRDPDRLTSAILRLLEDPTLRRRMGAAARARAEDRFDERRVVRTVVEQTRKLVASTGALPPVRGRTETPSIRLARPDDAPAMARLHRESMPEAFLPTLGDPFLARLHRAVTRDDDAVAFVAEERGAVVGFATAVPSVAAFYRRFGRRGAIGAGIAAAPMLVRPTVLRRAFETSRHPSRTRGLPDAELLVIAVDPGRRSNGIGADLAGAVAAALAARDVHEFKVVVGAGNAGANRFYERLGYRPARRIQVHEEEPSNVWVMTCPS